MSLWLDIMYMNQISFRLDRFKCKRPNTLYQYKCPLCGDSAKKANKIRGYFIAKGNQLNSFCHNCGASMSFGTFLKTFDVNLYNQYAVEKFKEAHGEVKRPRKSKSDMVLEALKTIPKTQKYVPDVLEPLQKICDLDKSHIARKYIEDRNIPVRYMSEIRYVPEFIKWAAGHTDKFKYSKEDHPRIVIPWFTESGTLFAYSARTIEQSDHQKYYNIVLDANFPKFYGLDKIDRSKRIYVLEGQFDSMFIPNSVAVGNSAIGQFETSTKVTYIPDRDVRNKEIMKIVSKLIDDGKDVCMLPHNLKGKDINEILQNKNLSINDLMTIIDDNTYSGLEAKLHFTKWRKI